MNEMINLIKQLLKNVICDKSLINNSTSLNPIDKAYMAGRVDLANTILSKISVKEQDDFPKVVGEPIITKAILYKVYSENKAITKLESEDGNIAVGLLDTPLNIASDKSCFFITIEPAMVNKGKRRVIWQKKNDFEGLMRQQLEAYLEQMNKINNPNDLDFDVFVDAQVKQKDNDDLGI